MPGFGVSPFGLFSGGSSPTAEITAIGDFSFSVKADSIGNSITCTLYVPAFTAAPEWNRNIRVLRKKGEYPISYDDSDAVLSFAWSYTVLEDVTDSFTDAGLTPLVDYYYSLFAQRNDGVWVHDRFVDRGTAYPYAIWGFSEYMFSNLPKGWQRADEGDLFNFLKIFGALFSDIKSDIDYLQNLFSIDNIREDLLQYLDYKIGWPTWHSANALRRRQDTANAISLCKLIGTKTGFESAIEAVSSWDVTIYEGWKYVMFTNGLFNSTLPGPFPDDSFIKNKGLVTDKFKYLNDTTTEKSWHSVCGVLLYLEYISGISEGLSDEALSRYEEIVSLVKPSYANVALLLSQVEEEEYPSSMLEDDYDDNMIFIGWV